MIQRSSGLPTPTTGPVHRPGKRQDKGVTTVFSEEGPLPPHKAPVWLGPLQKASALLSPRGWGQPDKLGR